jgi:RNA polymerase sigma-70 factor (ECF subfamily)
MDELAASAFRAHYDEVFRFVRRRTTTEDEAAEITQSVFAQAAARLDPVKQGSMPLLACLYTVAQRRLVDEARRRARRGTPLPLEAVEVASHERLYGDEVAHALKAALAALPRPQRDVVVLRLIEGRSFEEIAAQVGSSEGACKMRFLRGLRVVRDIFKGEGIEP